MSLQRRLLDELLEWKKDPHRKPLLVDGARQVGKTHLIAEIFGPQAFRRVHRVDFQMKPEMEKIFVHGLEPKTVLGNLEVHNEIDINIERDLIFFDEVGDCQSAVNSLKYFAERLPQAFVCASGSNIGLLRSFPVGKVDMLRLNPLCFEEFLMAAERPRLLEAFQTRQSSPIIHQQLWQLFRDYCFVGGMPEAVARWRQQPETAYGTEEDPTLPKPSLLAPHLNVSHKCTRAIKKIHRTLIEGYRQDFGKYSGPHDAQHINAVFSNVPQQLRSSHDDSVRRYRFKDVIPHKSRYRDFHGPIGWLETANLVSKCFPIASRPEVPLPAQIRPNIFKLFMFDVGLLSFMLNLTYPDHQRQDVRFKGFIAENFVQAELNARGEYPTYGWAQDKAEIEFLHRCHDGEIIPVEVKSGTGRRAKSLRSYLDRYRPSRAIKLVGGPGGTADSVVEAWPLYWAQFLNDL